MREELNAELLNEPPSLNTLVNDVIVGAMGAKNAMGYFRRDALLITPGDREDIILAACTSLDSQNGNRMAGLVLTGNFRPTGEVMKLIRAMPIPVLLAAPDSYEVAAKVHDLTVKTRPTDAEKIALIRDIIAKNVNVPRIVEAIKHVPSPSI